MAGAVVEAFRASFDEDRYRESDGAGQTLVRSFTTDSMGIVKFPQFEGALVLRASKANQCGIATVPREGLRNGVLLLKLSPGLKVVVVDDEGLPRVSVPVAIIERLDSLCFIGDRRRTNAEGAAWLHSDAPSGLAGGTTRHRLSVAVAIPIVDATELPIDLPSSLSQDVKLNLPPTGSVVVRIHKPNGEPFTDAATVELRKAHLGEADNRIQTLRARANKGVTRFPIVGLGLRLTAKIIAANGLKSNEVAFDGPTSRGAEAIATVNRGAVTLVLSGRLVGPTGQPIARTRLSLMVPAILSEIPNDAEDDPRRQSSTTDDVGRFSSEFDLDPASIMGTEVTIEVLHKVALGPDQLFDQPQELKVPLPQCGHGPADIGDVVVPLLPFIAAGKVVDDHGHPVPSAVIEMGHRDGDILKAVRGIRTPIGNVAQTDGTFELRGNARGDALGLIAHREGWFCREPVPFAIGATDIRVVMSQAGGIEGALSKADGAGESDSGYSEIKVFVIGPVPTSGGDPGALRRELPLRDGRFSALDLRPGEYTVEFRFTDSSGPVRIVGEVVVRAGEVNRDSRLQGVDLYLTKRRVTVTDERGHPLSGAITGVRADDAKRSRFAILVTGANGEASVVMKSRRLEVVVAAKGYVSSVLSDITGDVRVALKKTPARPVRLRLSDRVPLPDPTTFIAADLHWLAGLDEPRPQVADSTDPRSKLISQARFAPDGTATVIVYDSGVYELRLSLVRETGTTVIGQELSQGSKRAVIVVPDESPHPVDVAIDERDLSRKMR